MNPFTPLNENSVLHPSLWLGTWSLGGEGFGPSDERESKAVLEHAFDQGIRHFDTAGIYAHGKSEKLIAKVFKEKRKHVFLSSKGGLRWEGGRVIHAASDLDLKRDLEESLKRLQTDYLDLFQLHFPDPKIPIDESLAALQEFQSQGWIRHWGVGNFSAAEVRNHLPPSGRIPHQVHFNPIHQNTAEVLKAGFEEGRCFHCITSPLEQGLLGNSRSSQGASALGGRDLRRRNPYFHSEEVQRSLRLLEEKLSSAKISKITAVFHWLWNQPGVDAILAGPRTVSQLEEVLDATSQN